LSDAKYTPHLLLVILFHLPLDYDISKNIYKKFISKSHEQGIKIQALNANPSWIFKDNSKDTNKFLKWINNYNNNVSSNEQFSGVDLDVEPYLKEEWETDKKKLF
jgi:hypothetical protein